MGSARRSGVYGLAVVAMMGACVAPALASTQDLYYASATLGQTGQHGGFSVASNQGIGARFSIGAATTITGIGGHFVASNFGNGLLFGSIIRLDSFSDLPDSTDLSTPDVLAATTFTPPSASADVIAPIGPLAVTPGVYAVFFGSGRFGATGGGAIPQDGANIGSPSIFWLDSTPKWRSDYTLPARMTVYTPEPASALTLMCSAVMFICAGRHRSVE